MDSTGQNLSLIEGQKMEVGLGVLALSVEFCGDTGHKRAALALWL